MAASLAPPLVRSASYGKDAIGLMLNRG